MVNDDDYLPIYKQYCGGSHLSMGNKVIGVKLELAREGRNEEVSGWGLVERRQASCPGRKERSCPGRKRRSAAGRSHKKLRGPGLKFE